MRSPLSGFVLLIALVALVIPGYGQAQTKIDNCQDNQGVCAYQKLLKDALAAKERPENERQERIQIAVRNLLAPEADPGYLVLGLSEESVFDNVVNAWERARVDKQVGTSGKGAGTTDLVSRPSTPELLGLGVQLGALTETVSGSTATFTANA